VRSGSRGKRACSYRAWCPNTRKHGRQCIKLLALIGYGIKHSFITAAGEYSQASLLPGLQHVSSNRHERQVIAVCCTGNLAKTFDMLLTSSTLQ
jgi:hypothetical protein